MLKHISLYLNLELDGICCSDEKNFDPFKKLILDIIIKGRISQNKEVICCWHLNRHIFEEGDNEPEEVHPCYHLQFGGNRLLEWIDVPNSDQNILLIEPPRIPHPPLDIVLGVDFVLSNFYGRKWKNLREEIIYIKLVEEAQNLFWKSYSTSIASKWEDTLISAWTPKEIWPQLVF